MSWLRPEVLWLGLAVGLSWAVLRRVQRCAFDEIETRIAPRFQGALTRHSRRSLEGHLLLLAVLAMVLVVAAAGPFLEDAGGTVEGAGRVLLVVDASASMYATDIEGRGGEQDGPGEPPRESRMEHARRLALGLVEELPEAEFALASFSGETTLHLPMTARQDLVASALASLEVHSYYRNTGSSLVAALETAFHFVAAETPGLQVILLGDGELPYEEQYDEVVEALAAQGIAVHAVAFGTIEGQRRSIKHFQDVLDKVESPRILREYTTRRVDEHYREISGATGGVFLLASSSTAEDLAAALRDYRSPAGEGGERDPGRDLSPLLLTVFLVGFLFEAIVLGRRKQRPDFGFDLGRIGKLAGGFLCAFGLGLAACSDSPLDLAHRDNERGIEHDAAGLRGAARRAYERSIGFGQQSEIPTYNLGRSLVLAGAYSEAHDTFQRALEIEPELVAAYFNDGIALYQWGGDERDPKDCDLERTRDLWATARDRFALTVERAGVDEAMAAAGQANRIAVGGRLAEIDRLIAEPPAHCLGGGGEGGAGGGGGGAGGGGGGGGAGGAGEEGPGGGGSANSGGGGGQAGAPPPLSPEEQETVQQALQRILSQAYEAGKYHRRTLPEQFPRSAWADPDAEIWW